jgi:hypothetical protein
MPTKAKHASQPEPPKQLMPQLAIYAIVPLFRSYSMSEPLGEIVVANYTHIPSLNHPPQSVTMIPVTAKNRDQV